jgi:hypothetical protein
MTSTKEQGRTQHAILKRAFLRGLYLKTQKDCPMANKDIQGRTSVSLERANVV